MRLANLFIVLSLILPIGGVAQAQPHHQGVAEIVPARLPVATAEGQGVALLALSADWDRVDPRIRRAVIVVHGRLRNAATYFASGEQAAAAADASASTLVIAPQFLADVDVQRHGLPDEVLRWTPESWMGGLPAEAPAPLSSFAVFDAILTRLQDRRHLPNLREVVIAGHSGGGQVVQRYAVLGREGEALERAGLALRFVIANPSSYAYFSPERPDGQGDPTPFATATCPGFDDWKYGMRGLPPYAGDRTAADLERHYVGQRITYLLGERDNDPQHPALDKSCAARAQGPQRLARGHGYFNYLQRRHPHGLPQTLVTVPGVGHDGDAIFTSPQGRQALFGNRP